MTRHPLCQPLEHRLSRRQFVAGMSGMAAGWSMAMNGGSHDGTALAGLNPNVAEKMRKKEKQVIFIWLDGGISQLESWDPKPDTQFGGPFRAVPTTVPGTHFCELTKHSAKQAHHLAILRSVSTQDNSHSAGVGRINRGDPKDRGVVYPYLGSAVAKIMGPTSSKLPPYVWIKPYSGGFKTADAGFLGPKYGALAFGDGKPPENLLPHKDVSTDETAARNELRKRLNRSFVAKRRKTWWEANSYAFDSAMELMNRVELFDDTKVPQRDRDRYGNHDLGRHMLQGRRMLEAGVRFVKVNSYHWDSHGDHFNGSQSLIPQFDQPFAALIEDLHDRGLLDNVLVIAMSEFGRTPKINSHVGRDHWPEAWSVAMAGGGLKKGITVGKTSANGAFVDTDPYDIGHLFHTWFKTLGVNEEHMEYKNKGQPLPVAHDDCHPIDELIA